MNVKSAMDEVDEDWQHGLSAKVTKPEVKADTCLIVSMIHSSGGVVLSNATIIENIEHCTIEDNVQCTLHLITL